jgi:hypothetical protein
VKSLQERGEKDMLLGRLEEQLCHAFARCPDPIGQWLSMDVMGMLTVQAADANLIILVML